MSLENVKYAFEKSRGNTVKKILCVDDELYNLEILDKHLRDAEYETILTKNGKEALEALVKYKGEVSLVLLDRMMPGMDGIEVLRKMKSEPGLASIPVVMQTAAAEANEIIEGIKAGAYYYLTKPYSSDMLMAIVRSALEDSAEKEKNREVVEAVNEASKFVKEIIFEYKTLNDAYFLAHYISTSFYNGNTNITVSLTELLLNAVEHGNLGISHDKKAEMVLAGSFWSEVNNLLQSPENINKKVTVKVRIQGDNKSVNIRDEGSGFNWKDYVDFDPLRMTNPSGRGLAIAYIMSPDCIEFMGNGNEVVFKM